MKKNVGSARRFLFAPGVSRKQPDDQSLAFKEKRFAQMAAHFD